MQQQVIHFQAALAHLEHALTIAPSAPPSPPRRAAIFQAPRRAPRLPCSIPEFRSSFPSCDPQLFPQAVLAPDSMRSPVISIRTRASPQMWLPNFFANFPPPTGPDNSATANAARATTPARVPALA